MNEKTLYYARRALCAETYDERARAARLFKYFRERDALPLTELQFVPESDTATTEET